MENLDLVIRGAMIADGLGGPLVRGDVGVKDGRIVSVGGIAGAARRVIDADGALVTPGFVDTHSHYDGQVLWDPLVWSSSLHGTTTVVNGNCGVGFAPVEPGHRQMLIELMESIEEIPEAALRAGIRWQWRDFGQMLDAVGPHDIDIATLVAHNPLRLFVMGERASQGAPATAADIGRMAAVMGEAMAAGALGFSTSRAATHRTRSGEPVPARHALEEELTGIARGMPRGAIFQVAAGGATDAEGRRELALQHAIARTGVTLVVPVVAGGDGVTVPVDAWRGRMAEIEAIAAEGGSVWAQVAPRPVGVFLGLQATMNPFSGIAAYEEIAALPIDERLARMRGNDMRRRILAGIGQPRVSGKGFQGVLRVEAFEQMWELTDPPDYEPHPDDSLRSRAVRARRAPAELAYDIVTAGDGERLLYFAFFGYAGYNLDATRDLMLHERAVVGLGDGGAHVASVCDASYPTTLLAYWARDRRRGARIELPWAVQSLTSRPARAFGFFDRGVLAPGLKADINVIDFERLKMQAPRMRHDLPAGRKRLVQGADGILATLVSGEVTYENGRHTGALPGRVVRGPRRAPA
ncbi:MAG: amidohydrolase family protein [Gammaproteobacteria bacterium]